MVRSNYREKHFLGADDAVGKHGALTGVSERETGGAGSVFVWAEGAGMPGEAPCSHAASFLILYFKHIKIICN